MKAAKMSNLIILFHFLFYFRTSTLYAIIEKFIRDNYLGQVIYNIQNNIDMATKGEYSLILGSIIVFSKFMQQ